VRCSAGITESPARRHRRPCERLPCELRAADSSSRARQVFRTKAGKIYQSLSMDGGQVCANMRLSTANTRLRTVNTRLSTVNMRLSTVNTA
jgi:hypothetical protein